MYKDTLVARIISEDKEVDSEMQDQENVFNDKEECDENFNRFRVVEGKNEDRECPIFEIFKEEEIQMSRP